MEDAFKENILEGLDFVAKHDRLLTMGVKPTRPNRAMAISSSATIRVRMIYIR